MRLTASAYDPANKRFVILNGGEVWTLDPVTGTWFSRSPCLDRKAVLGFTRVAIGVFPQQMSLFGDPLWTSDLDGTSWSRRGAVTPLRPATPPQQTYRSPGLPSYDPRRKSVVIIGDHDVLESNAPDSMPGAIPEAGGNRRPRNIVAGAYDPAGGRVVAFTGGLTDWMWEFDIEKAAWTNVTPTDGTWPIQGQPLFVWWDRARGRLGVLSGPSREQPVTEVWEWNPADRSFTRRASAAASQEWPGAARKEPTFLVGYDESRAKLVAFADPDWQTIWEWNGETAVWTAVPTKKVERFWPTRRLSAALAYDAHRERFVIFGGVIGPPGSETKSDELWEWDGVSPNMVNRTPAVRPPRWPEARERVQMAYDPSLKRVVLLGDRTYDTLEWDGERGEWIDRSPGQRGPRDGTTPVYDPRRERMVFYDQHDNLWERESSTAVWSRRIDRDHAPEAWRFCGGSLFGAYDERRSVLFFAGGCHNPRDVAGVWEWNGESLVERPTRRGSTVDPKLHFGWPYQATYDVRTERVVAYWERSLVEWDGDQGVWVNATPATLPPNKETSDFDVNSYPVMLASNPRRGTLVLLWSGGDQLPLINAWEGTSAR